MDRLRAWLKGEGVTIVRPGLGANGIVTLRLRRPTGTEFEIDFYPDDLEANPEAAIEYLKPIVRRRQERL